MEVRDVGGESPFHLLMTGPMFPYSVEIFRRSHTSNAESYLRNSGEKSDVTAQLMWPISLGRH